MTDDATRETQIMSVGRPEDDPATVNYLEVVRLRALLAEERATSEGLRVDLDKALALFDRYRRIGFKPCKNVECYRATLTMMQESDAFLCEQEAPT